MFRWSLVVWILMYAGLALAQQAHEKQRICRDLPVGMSASDDQDLNLPLPGSQERPAAKSRHMAMLLSLVLPGAGQHYLGRSGAAKLFAGTESIFWLSYFGFRHFGQQKLAAAKGWAVLKAGANPYNRDDRYWVKMTYYDNRDRNEPDGFGYNQMIRVVERDNPLVFPETPEYYWNWDSQADRERYRFLRNQSKTAYKRADLALGAVLLNHVASAVEAYLSAKRQGRHLEFSGFSAYYAVEPDIHNPGFVIGIKREFH